MLSFRKFLFLLFVLSNGLCIGQQSSRVTLPLLEDENIAISLSVLQEADVSKADWLKLILRNKTSKNINIVTASYSINQEVIDKLGNNYIDVGQFGQGSKYDLIHSLHNVPNPSQHPEAANIPPMESIQAWKYLSNYAGSLLEGQKSAGKTCGQFELKFIYKIDEAVHELHVQNKEFCFKWTPSDSIPVHILSNRLKELIYDPNYRWINVYMVSALMKKEEVRQAISSEDLQQGVLLRENTMTNDENILFLEELKRRNETPSQAITEYYLQRLKEKKSKVTQELQSYWDDALLNELLHCKYNNDIYYVLELNANNWNKNPQYSNQVYRYLLESVELDLSEDVNEVNFKEWGEKIKAVAIARNPEFEKYLLKHLDDERTFEVIDWSRYRRYGVLPKNVELDKIKIRICDIAYVAWLRNSNHINFTTGPEIGTRFYKCTITPEIIKPENKFFSNFNNNIRLDLFEKEIKITPEIYVQIKN